MPDVEIYYGPWYTSEVTCENCGHTWVAVHPELDDAVPGLECPERHKLAGLPEEA